MQICPYPVAIMCGQCPNFPHVFLGGKLGDPLSFKIYDRHIFAHTLLKSGPLCRTFCTLKPVDTSCILSRHNIISTVVIQLINCASHASSSSCCWLLWPSGELNVLMGVVGRESRLSRVFYRVQWPSNPIHMFTISL